MSFWRISLCHLLSPISPFDFATYHTVSREPHKFKGYGPQQESITLLRFSNSVKPHKNSGNHSTYYYSIIMKNITQKQPNKEIHMVGIRGYGMQNFYAHSSCNRYVPHSSLVHVFTVKEALCSLREGFRPGTHLYPTDVLSWRTASRCNRCLSLRLSPALCISQKRFYTLVKHLNFYGCPQKTSLLALVGQ